MAPPRAKRMRHNLEDASVAREETEPTSSRRTRASRVAAAAAGDESMDSNGIEARSEASDAVESSGTRRITRASRARAGSAESCVSSARTRPFGARTTAATQTDDAAGEDNDRVESETYRRNLRYGRTSSNASVQGSATTPELSDEEYTLDGGEEEIDVEGDPPRERRAATHRALESLAELLPQRAIRPTRAAAVRARDATIREIAGIRASSAGSGRIIVADSTADGVDVGGILDEIMGQLAPGILEQFSGNGGTAREVRSDLMQQTYQFQRDSSTGRLNLVRGPDRPSTRTVVSGSTADETREEEGAASATIAPAVPAAAVAATVASPPRARTVTTVRLDLQIDVMPEEMARGGGDGDAPLDMNRILGDFEEIRRRDTTRLQSVEQQARIRLNQLTPAEVNRVVHRVILDCESAAARQSHLRAIAEREAAQREMEAAAERAVARAERAAAQQFATAAAAREAVDPATAALDAADEADERIFAMAREALAGQPYGEQFLQLGLRARHRSSAVAAAPAPAAAAAEGVRTRARMAAAALTLSEVPPVPSPDIDAAAPSDESASSSASTPTPPEEAPPVSVPSAPTFRFGPSVPSVPSSQQILEHIRARVVRELRHIRQARQSAANAAAARAADAALAAAERTSGVLETSSRATQPANEPRRGGIQLVAMHLAAPSDDPLAPLAALRDHVFAPPRSAPAPFNRLGSEITTNRLRDFIMYISQQASDNNAREPITAHFGGGRIDYRLRSIMNAGNAAIAGIVRRENRAQLLAALLRSIVDNVNNVERDPVNRQIEGNGRTARILTFHVRPLSQLQGTQIRTVFSDLIADGRGEPDPSELRLREQEDAEETRDSVVKSSEWGECRICMADEPCNPMGCKFCRQMVGCNKCCNRWHRAGRRPTTSVIDTLFASFRQDRERFAQLEQLRRQAGGPEGPDAVLPFTAAAATGDAANAAPAAVAPAAAGTAAGDAPLPENAMASALRSSLLSGAWESNCPLCRKSWRTKPQVVAMQRCRPLGEDLAEEDKAEEAPEAVEAVAL